MRLEVRKTYKLFIGGKFPRSESGRSYSVKDSKGTHLANVAMASRKDIRDAVVAARSAQVGWASASGYYRGQVFYRIAEMLEGRKEQFMEEIRQITGYSQRLAVREVENSIESLIYYSGWADKINSVAATVNSVSGPFYNFSRLEPIGVVGAIAPQGSALLGFVNTFAPILVSGNTAVVITSRELSLPALSLAEVLATSDLPLGVLNIVSGNSSELFYVLSQHADINGLDLEGSENWKDQVEAASYTLKRLIEPRKYNRNSNNGSLWQMLDFMEIKTVWHPRGH